MIRCLDANTVAKIAAGEVLHKPADALKELIENSIDAGATRVTITLVDGGLSKLIVADNGSGISHADLPLLCRRFATSKISSFDDLHTTLSSFGFRGEALASLSHVSHVQVTTRREGRSKGYLATYADGELVESRAMSVGTQGTTIQASDLFFNYPPRRRYLQQSQSHQIRRCIDVVRMYACRYSDIEFVLLRNEESLLHCRVAGAPLDRFAQIFGKSAKILRFRHQQFEIESDPCEFRCWLTPIQFRLFVERPHFMKSWLQQLIVVTFINGRWCECESVAFVLQVIFTHF